jgi:hypothetical protein
MQSLLRPVCKVLPVDRFPEGAKMPGLGCAQVVRVAVLALRNLLAAPGLEYGPDMVEAGLPKVVQQRQLQARSLAMLHLAGAVLLCLEHQVVAMASPWR